MAKRQYPKGKELAKNFLDKLKSYPNFEILSQSDVCHIRIDNDEYYLYFKCVTHEGKPYPWNTKELNCQEETLLML